MDATIKKRGIMSGKNKDYVKAILEFYKLILTALIGLLFIIYWNFTANPNISQSMDNTRISITKFILIFLVILIPAIMWRYMKEAEALKD